MSGWGGGGGGGSEKGGAHPRKEVGTKRERKGVRGRSMEAERQAVSMQTKVYSLGYYFIVPPAPFPLATSLADKLSCYKSRDLYM